MTDIKDIILFENDDYILVNKPYNMSTLDERIGIKISLLRIVKKYWADAQACHRLDKETSGCLAFAKTPAAYRHLSMQFEDRQVVKIYHAFITGIKRLENKEINAPILKSKDGDVRIDSTGKPSTTIFNTIEVFSKNSLIACMPITGRMHQIRIHLAHIGSPIVADKMYGGEDVFLSHLKKKFNLKNDTEEQPLISRVALHAHSLTFEGLDGQPIAVQAPYPKDIAALYRQLSKKTR